MEKTSLEPIIKSLALLPGIYIFRDQHEEVLYVGKAIRLRQRVRSYFARPVDLSPAKQQMVRRIKSIETIITASETEALILEAVHIKKHKPPYNVVLKDDKNYQFIKIDYRYNRPLVTTIRRPEEDPGRSRARYFGPYTSGFNLQESLRLLRRIFPWRKQDKELTKFELDLLKKRTLGPVPATDDEYRQMIRRLIRVLEGHSEAVISELQGYMTRLSAVRRYEQAAQVRNQIQALESLNSKQNIISVHGESQDVISLYCENDIAAVNVFVIRAGKLIDKLSFILQHLDSAKQTELLDAFLTQYYSEAMNPPKEIIIPVPTTITPHNLKALMPPTGGDIKFTIPKFGKKRELIALGETNARDYLAKSQASWQKQKHEAALAELKTVLTLPDVPHRIEGYDISNIQGQWAVGSMVVFTQGEPDKKEYRKFKIRTIKGANDFAMLAEVLKRRFSKAGWTNPNLVLLDGGKGQLSTVLDALASLPADTITPHHFIALAKKQEEIFQGKNLAKINLPAESAGSHLLQRVRDEAHRFAQAYYHTRHSRADRHSRLDEVSGLGPKGKKQLIQAFGSVAGIKRASKDDIIKLLGKAKAAKLLEQL